MKQGVLLARLYQRSLADELLAILVEHQIVVLQTKESIRNPTFSNSNNHVSSVFGNASSDFSIETTLRKWNTRQHMGFVL